MAVRNIESHRAVRAPKFRLRHREVRIRASELTDNVHASTVFEAVPEIRSLAQLIDGIIRFMVSNLD